VGMLGGKDREKAAGGNPLIFKLKIIGVFKRAVERRERGQKRGGGPLGWGGR